MLSCREFLALFGDYLDGLLTEEVQVHQELEAHLRLNPVSDLPSYLRFHAKDAKVGQRQRFV